MIGHFLGGVAVLIRDAASGDYLLLRRSSSKDFQSGEWECVTGRVDQGESYTQAAKREVLEEIGVSVQIELLLGVTHFYRGEATPENELLGVIFSGVISDRSGVQFGDEHSKARWLSVPEIQMVLRQNHWLLAVLDRAEQLRAHLPQEFTRRFLQDGFEF